jgi:FAD-dependent oxidoreductase domain-containing protein 1
MFHSALKSKAIELGAEFIKGEVKNISEIKAKTIISAAGCWTKELLKIFL